MFRVLLKLGGDGRGVDDADRRDRSGGNAQAVDRDVVLDRTAAATAALAMAGQAGRRVEDRPQAVTRGERVVDRPVMVEQFATGGDGASVGLRRAGLQGQANSTSL